MPFSVSWHTLLEELDGLADDAVLLTPLSHDRFQIVDVQEHRIIITTGESAGQRPLQREQFETLYWRIQEAGGSFELERLPPDAEPYPAVLSLHPRFEIDEKAGVVLESEGPTATQLLGDDSAPTDTDTDTERTEPDDVAVYSDALLLADALERNDLSDLSALETAQLVNIYTLCSDVQRNADDFRKRVADVLLDRLHHDQPVSGQYGSVQRTARCTRSLKNDQTVLSTLEAAGVDRDRVLSVDSGKVRDALEVTELPESAVYEIEEREYVRKADVNAEQKASRLQGLKDRLAASDGEASDELRGEIEALEERIDELTSFSAGATWS